MLVSQLNPQVKSAGTLPGSSIRWQSVGDS
jgi:hypothetical protein